MSKETAMSTDEVRSNGATGAAGVDTKLEIVVIPVSDIDRAKEFYAKLGWRLDADYDNGTGSRQRRGPGAAQLPLVRVVPRSGRQWLAVSGDHEPTPRAY